MLRQSVQKVSEVQVEQPTRMEEQATHWLLEELIVTEVLAQAVQTVAEVQVMQPSMAVAHV